MKRKSCNNCRMPDIIFGGDGRCVKCWGSGINHVKEAIDMTIEAVTGIEYEDPPCETCSGTGQCQSCGGEGFVYEDESKDEYKELEDRDDFEYEDRYIEPTEDNYTDYDISYSSDYTVSNSSNQSGYQRNNGNYNTSTNSIYLWLGLFLAFALGIYSIQNWSNNRTTKATVKRYSNTINRTGYISASQYANIRSGSSIEYSIIGKRNKGESVYVLERDINTGWYKIKFGKNLYGYISNSYISFSPVSKTPVSYASIYTFIGTWRIGNSDSRYVFSSSNKGVYTNNRGKKTSFKWYLNNNKLRIILDADSSVWLWEIKSFSSDYINIYSFKNRLQRNITRL